MQLQVKGKNMPVTDALFDHAERKLQRLTKILPPWDEPPIVELSSRSSQPEDRQAADGRDHRADARRGAARA